MTRVNCEGRWILLHYNDSCKDSTCLSPSFSTKFRCVDVPSLYLGSTSNYGRFYLLPGLLSKITDLSFIIPRVESWPIVDLQPCVLPSYFWVVLKFGCSIPLTCLLFIRTSSFISYTQYSFILIVDMTTRTVFVYYGFLLLDRVVERMCLSFIRP